MDSDCAKHLPADVSAYTVQLKNKNTVASSSKHKGVSYSNHDSKNGQYVFSQSWDPIAQECVYGATRSSRVSNGTLITRSSGIERYAAMLMPQQPFAVAGETALTIVSSVDENEMKTHGVQVQRLYGQQGTGCVSLINVNREVPANAPCLTSSTCNVNGNGSLQRLFRSFYAQPSCHDKVGCGPFV